jgi:hypothetical protein
MTFFNSIQFKFNLKDGKRPYLTKWNIVEFIEKNKKKVVDIVPMKFIVLAYLFYDFSTVSTNSLYT